ncbi:type I phosphodiesterase/nucleotide pyrophosphatase [Homoserinimonas aerilata]|uniref:Type I phosphodiesterase/nucleotide pyrophosphatase n=1 Tax=Homoserinimonas aerilata TaxID=1162970 RepID=A0A542YIR3_9MICO|nr:alkaline phosphatase family protein [Homoserinimonas aerilata]TQL47921.1 type I phosphodiesterase/nucleotide pyrophosphatase [Homoserinimonas aerilata]
MLPAHHSHRFSLADVLSSLFASVRHEDNALDLRPVDRAVVVVADGLGVAALRARSGHARSLMRMLLDDTAPTTIGSGFPTTTAAALATLTTGHNPGEHGIVGYTAFDAAHDRVVNQLTGWDDLMPPERWQLEQTLFERSVADGVPAFVVGAARYADSGFTRAVLRGAEFRASPSIEGRFEVARDILDANDRALVYLYVPELDQVSHRHGWESEQWIARLEELDSAVRMFSAGLREGEGALLTADHGVLDVPAGSHVHFDEIPGLLDGIRHVAGEPRCLQLHWDPDADEALRARTLAAWQASESARSWVVTREEAVAAGWFGPVVKPEVLPRIGDVLVAARDGIAYYDTRTATASARAMVGQHGSVSSAETEIPLLRMGDYAAS